MVHSSTRVVERLRLRADSQGAVRRAAALLEDAMRTASLPEAGARLLIVRALHLGPLPRSLSPQALSRLIEARFAAAGATVVHASDAAARRADAVWFRDTLEAHGIAAARLAADHALDEWFWLRAIPALPSIMGSGEPLRAMAFTLAIREDAPAAVPAWTASLVRGGHAARLLTALRPGDGAALLRASALDAFPRTRVRSQPAPHDPPPTHPRGDAVVDEPVRGPGNLLADAESGWHELPADDDRLEFVERVLGLGSGAAPPPRSPRSGPGPVSGTSLPTARPARSLRAASPVPSNASVATVHRQHPPGPGGGATPVEPPHAVEPCTIATPPPSGREDKVPTGSAMRREIRRPDPEARTAEASTQSNVLPAAHPCGLPYGERTAAGGLLFLVPLLERLGYGDWWAAANAGPPAVGPVAAVFHELLSRSRLDAGDPAWELAAPAADAWNAPPDRATSALVMSRLESIGAATRPELDAGLRAATTHGLWLAACRRVLRRRVGIGLASVVTRPARLAIGATHVDLFFPLSAVDVRVRRAGLDVDPGWVPWLGRVVAFHYVDRGRGPEDQRP